MPQKHSNTLFLLSGSYTDKTFKHGLQIYSFNTLSGECTPVSGFETENPSWIEVGREGRVIYAVNENHEGSVSFFSFDRVSGQLSFMNKVSSGGSEPCYITYDNGSNQLIAGNYGDGSFSVIGLEEDGSPGQEISTIKNKGYGPDRNRQEGPHVHCTVLSPDNMHLLVSDLGTDKVYIFSFDIYGRPVPEMTPFISVEPGSGPRLLMFHPVSGTLYLIHEMGGFITAYDYHNGIPELKQQITLIPPGYSGEISAAHIQASPDGNYFYASNRGNANEIIVFSVDRHGLLNLIGRESSMGLNPRNFTIDPTGRFLLVANQNSNEIVTFKRDVRTGSISATNNRITVRQPVFLKFI